MVTGLLPRCASTSPSLPRAERKKGEGREVALSVLALRDSLLGLDGDGEHPVDREAGAVGHLGLDFDGRGHVQQGLVELP